MNKRGDTLQGWMAAAIQQPSTLLDDPAMREACEQHIAQGPRLSPVEQLDIYREQFFLRHVDSLAEDFPGVAFFVGEPRLRELIVAYLAAHPPTSFTLRDLGQRFPEFLRTAADVPHRAAVVDMADVEWAFVEVFDAPDGRRIDAAVLASVPETAWDRAVLHLHPTIRCLSLRHPVHRVREAVLAGEAPELPPAGHVNVVLFRDELQLRYEEVDDDVLALMGELSAGVPLGSACERVAARFYEDDPPALAPRLQAAFARFTQLGWLVGVDT